MALPRLLTPECQEEASVVPEQADVLAFQYLAPKKRHCDDQLSTIFTPFTTTPLRQHKSTWWRDVLYASRWPARTYLNSREIQLNALIG